jgi:hypothetical protein
MNLANPTRSGIVAAVLTCGFVAAGQAPPPLDLVELVESDGFAAFNRALTAVREGDRAYVQLDGRPGSGVAWLKDVDFIEGTLEVELRGRDVPGRSFVGIAYHGVDDETYEAIYFRPFNFRAEDPARRAHAVQYIAHPKNTWRRLRELHPGQYEMPIVDPPDAEAWLRARILVSTDSIRVFVNGSEQPSLEVTPLREPRSGRVGLWVGNGSPGDFAALSVTPASQWR